MNNVDFSLMFLAFFLHVGTVGVFLLIAKTTIWDDSSFLRKLIILSVMYFSYAFLVGPNVEDFARAMLGKPARAVEEAERAERQRIPEILPGKPAEIQPVLQ